MLLQQSDLKVKTWNVDTVKRLDSAEVRSLLDRWEFLEQRNSLVDGITMLRAAVQVASSDEDLVFLLRTLFLEQRAGMRKPMASESALAQAKSRGRTNSNETRTPTNIMKSILVRRNVYWHLIAVFPKFSAEIENIMSVLTFTKTVDHSLGPPSRPQIGNGDGAER